MTADVIRADPPQWPWWLLVIGMLLVWLLLGRLQCG